MVDINEEIIEFRIVVVSRDASLAEALAAELSDANALVAQIAHFSNCYEAAAEILANPPHATVIDLRCLTRQHLRLLDICNRFQTEMLAVGPMPLGITTGDLDGVRLCAIASMSKHLRRIAKATDNIQTGEYHSETLSLGKKTPCQTKSEGCVGSVGSDANVGGDENVESTESVKGAESAEIAESVESVEGIKNVGSENAGDTGADNPDTTQALARWIIEASQIDATPSGEDKKTAESAAAPAPARQPSLDPYTDNYDTDLNDSQSFQNSKSFQNSESLNDSKDLYKGTNRIDQDRFSAELLTSAEISALLENE